MKVIRPRSRSQEQKSTKILIRVTWHVWLYPRLRCEQNVRLLTSKRRMLIFYQLCNKYYISWSNWMTLFENPYSRSVKLRAAVTAGGSTEHRVARFAYSMGLSAMANRMAWLPSLPRYRKLPRLTKCTHSHIVRTHRQTDRQNYYHAASLMVTRLSSDLRHTTRECVCFRSVDKDGGHTIRSTVAKNPLLHANFTSIFYRTGVIAFES